MRGILNKLIVLHSSFSSVYKLLYKSLTDSCSRKLAAHQGNEGGLCFCFLGEKIEVLVSNCIFVLFASCVLLMYFFSHGCISFILKE